MEHPLIGPLDELTVEELSTKINELNNKLAIATRTGNGHLCGQIRMAIESYNFKYQQRVDEQYRKATKQAEDQHLNFDNKINIR
jgi:hypothetical protein